MTLKIEKLKHTEHGWGFIISSKTGEEDEAGFGKFRPDWYFGFNFYSLFASGEFCFFDWHGDEVAVIINKRTIKTGRIFLSLSFQKFYKTLKDIDREWECFFVADIHGIEEAKRQFPSLWEKDTHGE